MFISVSRASGPEGKLAGGGFLHFVARGADLK